MLGVYVTLRIIDAVRYSTLKKDITTIGEEINKAAPATKHKPVQYCEYSSMKFQRGPRGCHVEYYAYYEGIDKEKAISITDEVKKIVGEKHELTKNDDIVPDKQKILAYSFEDFGTYCYICILLPETRPRADDS